MADKEKRILILEVNPDCKALRFDCDPFDDEDGMFCNKSGRYVRITEKDCKKCKSPVLTGITRAEAVEIMAKAMRQAKFPKTKRIPSWSDLDRDYQAEYLGQAEAALDALLGKEARNDIH